MKNIMCKTFLKMLSTVLSISLLFTSIAINYTVSAENDENIYFYDDFSIDRVPDALGFNWQGADGATETTLKAVSFGNVYRDTDNKCLVVSGGNDFGKLQLQEEGNMLTGDSVISFRFKLDELSGVYCLYRGQYLGYTSTGGTFSLGPWIGVSGKQSDGNHYLFAMTGGGKEELQNDAKVEAGKWHEVKMILNTETNSFELQFDGVTINKKLGFKIDTSGSFTSQYKLYKPLLIITWDPSRGGDNVAANYSTVCYDDIKIERYVKPVDEDADVYFKDDFETDKSPGVLDGYWKDADGNNTIFRAGSYNEVVVKDGYLEIGNGSGDGKFQLVASSGTWNGDFTFSFKFKMDNPTAVPVLYRSMYKMTSPGVEKFFGPYMETEMVGGKCYVSTVTDGNGTAQMGAEVKPGEWNTVVVRMNASEQTYQFIYNDRLIGSEIGFQIDGGTMLSTAYELHRPLMFLTGSSVVCYDDILIRHGIPKDTTSGDDVYDDSITSSAPLSKLEGWTDVNGNATVELDPAADCDQAVLVPDGGEVYKSVEARNGKVNAEAYMYLDEKATADFFISDNEGNILAGVSLDKYILKGLSYDGHGEILASVEYPAKSWFPVKLSVDLYTRCLDVYVDNVKINKSPVNFYNTFDPSDTGLVARMCFAASGGKVYIDDLSVESVGTDQKLNVTAVNYKDKNGKTAKLPTPGGKIDSIVINNTLSAVQAVVCAASYDSKGKLYNIDFPSEKTVSEGVSVHTFSDVKVPSSGGEVKTFVWEGDTLNPLTEETAVERIPSVIIAGDTMAANYGTDMYPYTGWGTVLGEIVDENAKVINMSVSGKSSKEYISDGHLDEVREKLFPGDYMIVAAAGDSLSEADYKSSLESYIEAAESCGATCIFVTSPDKFGEGAGNYTEWMKAVADENSVSIIDLNSAWESFLSATDNDKDYYAYPSEELKNSYLWEISDLNNGNFTGNSGVLSPAGATKAAEFVANGFSDLGLELADYVVASDISYSVSNGRLTVSGNGKMPVYESFGETPWGRETGITSINVTSGVTSISTDAFSGFNSLKDVDIAESVREIGNDAFPNTNINFYGYLNSAAQKYAEDNENVNFAIKELRIMAIGNSHTVDYTQFSSMIFGDMAKAGVKTQITLDRVIRGGHTMYAPNSLDSYGDIGHYNSHYVHGTDPDCLYAGTYNLIGTKKYDLVVIQDYWESAVGRSDFETGVAKTMRWLRDRQPEAEIAWVVDWTEMNTAGGVRNNIRTIFDTNTVKAMQTVDKMTEDAPDYYIPMGTALQNARSSYLGNTWNYVGCFTSTGTTDWAQSNIGSFNVLERDITHVSFELGRYLVGTAVFAKIYDRYEDVLWKDAGFDYYDSLVSIPDSSADSNIGPWVGEVNDSIMNIIKESARNAIETPKACTQSAYTVDPADAIAQSVAGLSYTNFTATGIASTVNSANLGISISSSDVAVSNNSATITFVYGYTRKTVNITK